MGYQGKGLKNGDFTWSAGTFVNIGTDADKMTLKDVKLIRTKGDMSCGKVKLYLLGANGANLKITDEESPFKGQSASFMYMDEVEAEEWRGEEGYEYVVAGWYHEKDEDYEYPMNEYPVDAALGFSVKAMADNYQFQLPGAL